MKSEKKARNACLREAKQELARRERESQASIVAQEVDRHKDVINDRLSGLQAERDKLVQQTVALRKTNPGAAKIMIAQGASIDAAILQAQQSLAMASSLGIERRIEDLIEESYALISRLKTEPIRFRTAKDLKKLKEKSQLQNIMKDLAEKSRRTEWAIYTSDVGSGAGSTFEADVEAAERQAQIDIIDD